MPNSITSTVKNTEQTWEQKVEAATNELVKNRIHCHVVWTNQEHEWRFDNEACPRTLCTDITKIIRNSATGCFISNWNFGKEIDSSSGLKPLLDMEKIEGRTNTWSEDEESIIKQLVTNSQDRFSWKKFMNKLSTLRLNWLNIGEIDSSLQSLDNIQTLILSSIKLKICDGSLLPRNLKYLELYNNYLSNTDYLANDPPSNILYLGIGRNKFITSESLQSLVNYKNIQYLDLSDNDLMNLQDCIKVFKELKYLKGLSLCGTPCSMAASYTQTVFKELPTLIVFDGVNLKSGTETREKKKKSSLKDKPFKGKNLDKNSTDTNEFMGELQVTCYRLISVKKPQEQKNIKHLYFIELECPLADEGLKIHEKQKLIEEITNDNAKLEKKGSSTAVTKEPLGQQWRPSYLLTPEPVKTDKKPKKPQNDLLTVIKSDFAIEGCTNFKSAPIEWSEMMTFKQPIVVNTDLQSLRDIFRSVLKLRLFHVKVKDTGDRNSKRNLSEVVFQEKLAVILIPLHMIKWNDKYLGYQWDTNNPWKAEIYPNVKDIKYLSKKQCSPSEMSKTPPSPSLCEPTILTVHIGVSVKRDA